MRGIPRGRRAGCKDKQQLPVAGKSMKHGRRFQFADRWRLWSWNAADNLEDKRYQWLRQEDTCKKQLEKFDSSLVWICWILVYVLTSCFNALCQVLKWDIYCAAIVDVLNLPPHTHYTATVQCIPLVDGTEAGFWSDPSRCYFHTTQDGMHV